MVSNRRVLFLYKLEINRIERIYRFKRGTAMPRSELEVVGKPLHTNVVIAVHAICMKTTMPSLCVIVKFPTFPIHKISITLLNF